MVRIRPLLNSESDFKESIICKDSVTSFLFRNVFKSTCLDKSENKTCKLSLVPKALKDKSSIPLNPSSRKSFQDTTSPFSLTVRLEVVRPTPCSEATGTTLSKKRNLTTVPARPTPNKLSCDQLSRTKTTAVLFPAQSIMSSIISLLPGPSTSKCTVLSCNFTIKRCSIC